MFALLNKSTHGPHETYRQYDRKKTTAVLRGVPAVECQWYRGQLLIVACCRDNKSIVFNTNVRTIIFHYKHSNFLYSEKYCVYVYGKMGITAIIATYTNPHRQVKTVRNTDIVIVKCSYGIY